MIIQNFKDNIMMRVLVVGSTGYLGKFIVKNLIERNLQCVALARTPSKLQHLQQSIEIIEADVTNTSSLINCCDNIDIVISTLGITKQQDGLSYMDIDYQANLNILNEALRCAVKKFIYVSVFNGDALQNLQICQAKEKFVNTLINSGLDYCIVRPTGFFSDMTEFYNMAKKGRIYLFGKGQYKSNPIHGDDLAQVCIDAITEDQKQISVGGPDVFTQTELATLAFDVLSMPVKITYIPDFIRVALLKLCKLIFSTAKYGPIEFFLNVLVMDMSAPKSGVHKLRRYFESLVNNKTSR
nr:SDR family oxidoreductase [Psychromonas sp. CNPT3]